MKKNTDRRAGVLCPLSVLPGRHETGDLGKNAYRFIDWLADAGFREWALLPLNPTSFGNSPYQTPGSCAGNINYISDELLIEEGYLTEVEFAACGFIENSGRVNYKKLFDDWTGLLRNVCYPAFVKKGADWSAEYADFCEKNRDWLDDYALFTAIKEEHGYVDFRLWPEKLAARDKKELEAFALSHRSTVDFVKFTQFIFFRHWNRLKTYAAEKGIELMGDMPFYVAPDSADVWAEPELFDVVPGTGQVCMWAGVPSDEFSGADRNWGNPVYRWEKHMEDGYRWFRRRIRVCAGMYDCLRIDHYIATMNYFGIKYGETKGEWFDGPDKSDKKLTDAICEEAYSRGLSLIAEDLGKVPEGLRERMAEKGIPGMRILQFAFTGKYGAKSNHLPFCHTHETAVYTGTHDNPTLKEYIDGKSDHELEYLKWWTNTKNKEELYDAVLREAFKSPADRALIPLQDILGMGEEARICFGSDYERSWLWKLPDLSRLDRRTALKMRKMLALTGRIVTEYDEFDRLLRGRKTVLITGASGFIGTNLTEELLAAGYKVIALDIAEPFCGFDEYGGSFTFVRGDIRDGAALERVFAEPVDYVFHLAAISTVQAGSADSKETADVNVNGTAAVLRAAESAGVKGFVYASTDKVYGELRGSAYREDDPLTPLDSPYDISKAEADKLVRSFAAERGFRCAVIRFCNIYGKYDLHGTRIIPNTVRSVYEGQSCLLRVYRGENGRIQNFMRDFLYAGDLCRTLREFIDVMEDWNSGKESPKWGEAFNLGAAECSSIDELIGKIEKACGRKAKIRIELSESVPEVKTQRMDYSKAEKHLGFVPRTSIGEGLEITAAWWKKYLETSEKNKGEIL